MHAKVGDHLLVTSQHVGERARHCEVLEVRGPGGEPPYLVRWSDGHEGLYFPAGDAVIEQTTPVG